MDEVKGEIFFMKAKGTPSSDGFGGSFYHYFWDLVQQDGFNLVNYFFRESWLPQNFNPYLVVLIPKTP